jgi:hypothetical protein
MAMQVFCAWNLSKHKVSTALQWVPAELASLKKVEFMPLHEVRSPCLANHADPPSYPQLSRALDVRNPSGERAGELSHLRQVLDLEPN